jgi:hypothetical protein
MRTSLSGKSAASESIAMSGKAEVDRALDVQLLVSRLAAGVEDDRPGLAAHADELGLGDAAALAVRDRVAGDARRKAAGSIAGLTIGSAASASPCATAAEVAASATRRTASLIVERAMVSSSALPPVTSKRRRRRRC